MKEQQYIEKMKRDRKKRDKTHKKRLVENGSR